MASTATTRNRLEKQGVGDNSGTWGTVLNTNVFDLVDESLDGYESIAVAANVTLTSTNYATDQARKRFLKFTGAGGFNVTAPGVQKWYIVWNACTSAVAIKTAANAGVSIASGVKTVVFCDGTDFHTIAPPVSFLDGSAAAPSAYFANDTDTGFYRVGANSVGLSLGGTNAATYATTGLTYTFGSSILSFSSSGLSSTAPALLPAATTSLPSLRIPHGVAPTSPTNGDHWTDASGHYTRLGGTTYNLAQRVLVASGSSSTVANIDLALTSGFTYFELDIPDVAPTVGGGIYLALRFSADNGATYPSGIADYDESYIYLATTASVGAMARVSSFITLTGGISLASTAHRASGKITIWPGDTAMYPSIRSEMRYLDDATTTPNHMINAGQFRTAGRATHIRIVASSSTMNRIIYRLWGIR